MIAERADPALLGELLRTTALIQTRIGEFTAALASARRSVEICGRGRGYDGPTPAGRRGPCGAHEHGRQALSMFEDMGVPEADLVRSRLAVLDRCER